jgi:hypothetical protein
MMNTYKIQHIIIYLNVFPIPWCYVIKHLGRFIKKLIDYKKKNSKIFDNRLWRTWNPFNYIYDVFSNTEMYELFYSDSYVLKNRDRELHAFAYDLYYYTNISYFSHIHISPMFADRYSAFNVFFKTYYLE